MPSIPGSPRAENEPPLLPTVRSRAAYARSCLHAPHMDPDIAIRCAAEHLLIPASVRIAVECHQDALLRRRNGPCTQRSGRAPPRWCSSGHCVDTSSAVMARAPSCPASLVLVRADGAFGVEEAHRGSMARARSRGQAAPRSCRRPHDDALPFSIHSQAVSATTPSGNVPGRLSRSSASSRLPASGNCSPAAASARSSRSRTAASDRSAHT